jgi:hypothetical protein
MHEINQDPPFVEELRWFEGRSLLMGEGLPFNCKISLLMRRPPITIQIEYENDTIGMTMYGSFDHQLPNRFKKHMARRGRIEEIEVFPKNQFKADYEPHPYFYM